jgi:hypothetical protein
MAATSPVIHFYHIAAVGFAGDRRVLRRIDSGDLVFLRLAVGLLGPGAALARCGITGPLA